MIKTVFNKLIIFALCLIFPVLFTPCIYANTGSIPVVMISEGTAEAGGTAKLTVSIADNPGIVSMRLNISFNSEYLTLTNVEDSGLLPGAVHKAEYESPYILLWSNGTATQNYTGNGTLASLTFKVSDNAPSGKIPVEVGYTAGDIINYSLKTITAGTVNGGITVNDSSAPEPADPGSEDLHFNAADSLYIPSSVAGGVLICAGYDNSGKMIEIQMPGNINAGENVSISWKYGSDIKVYKAFILSSSIPMCDSAVLRV